MYKLGAGYAATIAICLTFYTADKYAPPPHKPLLYLV